MTIVKRITDLRDYTSVLPYDSEMFGIYQPLLGWKSKRIAARFGRGLKADQEEALHKLLRSFAGIVSVTYKPDGAIDIKVDKGLARAGKLSTFDSIVLQTVGEKLPPYSAYQASIWQKVVTEPFIASVLKGAVPKAYVGAYASIAGKDENVAVTGRTERLDVSRAALNRRRTIGAFESQLAYESSVAGAGREQELCHPGKPLLPARRHHRTYGSIDQTAIGEQQSGRLP